MKPCWGRFQATNMALKERQKRGEMTMKDKTASMKLRRGQKERKTERTNF